MWKRLSIIIISLQATFSVAHAVQGEFFSQVLHIELGVVFLEELILCLQDRISNRHRNAHDRRNLINDSTIQGRIAERYNLI